MKKLTLILLIALNFSCSKQEPICCTVIDIGLSAKILNSENENLLEIPNGVTLEDIQLFYFEENDWKQYKGYGQSIAKGFKISDHYSEGKVLSIGLAPDYQNEVNTSFRLKFPDSKIFDFVAEIDFSYNNTVCTKIYCNDDLAWDIHNQGERIITIEL